MFEMWWKTSVVGAIVLFPIFTVCGVVVALVTGDSTQAWIGLAIGVASGLGIAVMGALLALGFYIVEPKVRRSGRGDS